MISQQLQGITEDALRRAVIFFAIFAIPTTLASILRGIRGEWLPAFTLQLVMLAVLLVVAALFRRIPHKLLGGIIIALSTVVALAGLFTYGTIAPAGHWFVALAIFFVGMLHGLRGMLVGGLALLAGMLAIAWLYLAGYASPAVAAADFAIAPGNWLIELMCAAVFMAIVLPTARNFVTSSENWMWEFEQRRRKIRHLAMHDELTGLPLLRSARDRLAMACNRSRRSGNLVGVLFIDLDGFKQVNDNFGHEAGDTCLRAVAGRLSRRLRVQDTVARIGGDEFVVVLEDVTDEDAAGRLAAELIALISQPVDFEGRQLHIGASIGVALCPKNGDSAPSLLRKADQAMYRSKRSGKNGFVFAQDLHSQGVDEEHYPEREEENEMIVAAAARVEIEQLSMRRQLSASIVNRCILVLAGSISLTVLANIWRITQNETAPNLGPTLAALAVSILLLLGRDHIPLRLKIAFVSIIGILIALPGVFASGLAGPAVGWGFAASIFLVGIFYNWRLGAAIAILVAAAIILSGLGFASGTISYRFDVNQQALHPSKWLVFILAAITYSAMVLATWWQYKKTVSHLIQESTVQIAELVKLATIDELTGLPHLRLAMDRLDVACRRAERTGTRAALLLVDLDGFKAINDTYGHDAGDYCLCEVARRLSAHLRASDTAARIGGDEFLVILDSIVEVEQVSVTTNRIIKDIARPMDFHGHNFSVSATIGIAMFPDHGNTGDTLRQHADAAMYAAKRSGKNRFQFAHLETLGKSA